MATASRTRFSPTSAVLTAAGLFVLALALLVASPAAVAAAPISSPSATVLVQQQGPIVIPQGTAPVKVDGRCDPRAEYGDAASYPYTDAFGVTGQVYLKHDGTNLYVCMVGAAGSFGQRFARVYLDTDDGRETYAEADDYALQADFASGGRSSYKGTGVANGYTPISLSGWSAATATGNADIAEYAVPLSLIGGLCGRPFGLAVYHHWVQSVGNDYGWPSNQFFDQPKTWQEVTLGNAPCAGKIAYVYYGNTADATSFRNLLTSRGYAVTLIPLAAVLTTNFSQFDLILIANDSGSLDAWGTSGLTAAQVAQITAPNKPIIGLGEGGYAFFGRLGLFIGWPQGWHGPNDRVIRAAGAPASYYTVPTAMPPDPIQVYGQPSNEVGIYLSGVPADVLPIGLEPATPDHASLIMQGCRHLWGFSGNPDVMTATGRELFVNAVYYFRHFQCAPPPPPPSENCIRLVKQAAPPNGTPVQPGDPIQYTLTYFISQDARCQNTRAKLVDQIPMGTTYVPGSASDGISPGADGALTWDVTFGSGVKTFKVQVSDTACRDQRRIINQATLLMPGHTPFVSNVVSHPVDCPPIGFPNDQPSYAEEEVQIHPYPLITGTPSQISVKLRNNTAVAQTVTVLFQTSPNRFGIGLDFNTFDSTVVTIPANGNVIAHSSFTPVSSGHYCIQIVVLIPGYAPVITQRNLDVVEDLQPGVTDTLVFKVRNNSSATANVDLVVVNTCPGWTAVVVPATLINMLPGEVRNAQLQVTPPNPVVLGSGCHIDVQGWIGDQMIGGIRKLDVPPVHLPVDVQPPWAEPEISVHPSPPVVGQPAQICVQLQNPLPVAKTVTVDFAVADFGAGIPFTTVATQTFVLPPLSNATYCAPWTPALGGTTHRCILVTLKQPNYPDQHSQLNVNVVRTPRGVLSRVDVPIRIGNPDGVAHALELRPVIFGIDPYWQLRLWRDPGDPPPDMLGPGEIVTLHLGFMPAGSAAAGEAPAAPPADYTFGDESRVELGVYLDGQLVGGLSVEVRPPERTFLPVMLKR
ncbi:MAG: hypothetical protein AUK03_09195 [Anaerolineae bacterium CG2_30_64_16]|nr:MAG: hypothetical protein AUK03_09195 [Anaerolineae bacterium CG2_30_64_16]